MTAALIGLAVGIGFAIGEVTRMLPPYSIGELLLTGVPGPYPDGDRLPPPPEDDE